MAWSDFYLTPTGNDANAGSTTGDNAVVTVTNKDWDNATGSRFTGANGDFTGVTVGMYASIYLDGATAAVFVSKITGIDAVNAAYIDVSKTANKLGTAPAAGANGRSCKVGGAWASLAVVTSLFVSQTVDQSTRVNVKAGTYANTTTARAFAAAGTTAFPIWWRGYYSSPGDLDDGTHARDIGGLEGIYLPLFTFSTGQMTAAGSYQLLSNIGITSQCVTSGGAFSVSGTYVKCVRIRVENTQAHANARAFSSAGIDLVGCRFKATRTADACVRVTGTARIYGCHVIGGIIGVTTASCSLFVNGSIVESFSTTGINFGGSSYAAFLLNSTVYCPSLDATNGVWLGGITTGTAFIGNSIIGGCTNGINATAATFVPAIMRVHFCNCTNNLVNITELADVTADLGVALLLFDNDTNPFPLTTNGSLPLLTSGSLEVGAVYTITTYVSNDDFTNVGAGSNAAGVRFTATGTTPTHWAHSSVLAREGNWNLAAGNAVDKSAGYPGVFEGQISTVAYPDIGAVRHQDPAGDYPSEDDVRDGVDYDSAAMTGNMTLPAVGDVRDGTTYGTDGTEFEGTLAVTGGTVTGGRPEIRGANL